MSIAPDYGTDHSFLAPNDPPIPGAKNVHSLHRIGETRRRQGVSLRSAARRLGTSVEQVRREEDPQHDMLISELYKWQQALEVPVSDLLVESDSPMSEPVLTRARLLRVMKTVRAIKESTKSESVERLATMMEQQLVEMMPELSEVSAWHSVGQRRSPKELGRAAERSLPDSFFTDMGS